MTQRIQRKRTKGWRMPEGAIYVGRPSAFGNPAVIELDRSIRNAVNPWHLWAGDIGPGLGWFVTQAEARGAAVRFFREWLATTDGVVRPKGQFQPPTHAYVSHHGTLHARLSELAGRDLACWCPLDQPCHADVLLQIANEETP